MFLLISTCGWWDCAYALYPQVPLILATSLEGGVAVSWMLDFYLYMHSLIYIMILLRFWCLAIHYLTEKPFVWPTQVLFETIIWYCSTINECQERTTASSWKKPHKIWCCRNLWVNTARETVSFLCLDSCFCCIELHYLASKVEKTVHFDKRCFLFSVCFSWLAVHWTCNS